MEKVPSIVWLFNPDRFTILLDPLINPTGPDVSIVIVSYNTAHLLDRLLTALESARGNLTLQTVIVDNASRDGSVEQLKQNFPQIKLIENSRNLGFGRANNQALPWLRGRYVLLLNSDAFVSPDTLEKTIRFMDKHLDCGVLGVKLLSEDGSLQPCCRYFPTPWNVFLVTTGLAKFFPNARLIDDMRWDHNSVRHCDWVPGCYYLTRRDVIDKIGLFDPRYFLYCEEVDHCRRVQQAGWKIVYYPDTRVVHIGGESAGSGGNNVNAYRQISELQNESELLYFRKHHGLLGLAASVCLTILADASSIVKRLTCHRDLARAKIAMAHSISVIRALLETKLASRPTH